MGEAADSQSLASPTPLSRSSPESTVNPTAGKGDLALRSICAATKWLKRAIDVVISLSLLPLVLPLMAICGVLAWLTEGRPILFAQDRTGRAGRRFKLYKLRTMVKDATELKGALLHQNDLSGPDFKMAKGSAHYAAGWIFSQVQPRRVAAVHQCVEG